MLSFVQYGNTLWGFQMAWYLVMLALTTTLFILDRPTLTWVAFTGAAGAAIVGSFSSLQGLLIWPAGLVLLYHRHRVKKMVIVWVVAAVTSAAVYFYRFNFNEGSPDHSYAIDHPLAAAKFYLFALGDVIGESPGSGGTGNNAVLLLGATILLAAISAIVIRGFRRNETDGSPIGIALICFGLLFAAFITQGRIIFGYSGAGGSSYSTFDLLVLVGIYLVLLDPPVSERTPARLDAATLPFVPPRFQGRPRLHLAASSAVGRWDEVAIVVTRGVLFVAILLQVVFGNINGLSGGRTLHGLRVLESDVLVNIDKAADNQVADLLNPHLPVPPTRRLAKFARSNQLSLFATGAVAMYTKDGLDERYIPAAITGPSTQVLVPSGGATLSGKKVIDASATDNVRVTKVEFQVTGGQLHSSPIAVAALTRVGWVANWKTTIVTNGIYTLQSVAIYAKGRRAYSKGVTIDVNNK
jgi:hypothetical protein